ncbi:MAG TPA: hypothetical protein VLB04_03190, partial [Methanotrichaceae archaeon]|nr:hypothetical protein [Methanotrichaceae archaeon]
MSIPTREISSRLKISYVTQVNDEWWLRPGGSTLTAKNKKAESLSCLLGNLLRPFSRSFIL